VFKKTHHKAASEMLPRRWTVNITS